MEKKWRIKNNKKLKYNELAEAFAIVAQKIDLRIFNHVYVKLPKKYQKLFK